MKKTKTCGFLAVATLVLGLVASVANAQTYSDLYNFGDGSGDPLNPQYSGLVAQGRDGNLYSTTPNGGRNALGTVFNITAQGAISVLYHFDGTHGKVPYSGLTLGTDGNLYGTTSVGGSGNLGVIFQITPAGALTVLHTFASGDGITPYAPPIQAADGNFYGTAAFGGASGYGTVYKLTPSGAYKVLHSFDLTNGSRPFGPLVQGNDGNFYGTTYSGVGTNRYGIVFKVTGSGAFTILHSFNLTDGANPYAGLVLGKDGNFYGTTFNGGSVGYGNVFKITPAGTLTVLHSFTPASDGGTPYGNLVQATDGNFYGVGYLGGMSNHGTIFRITPAGTFSTRYSFDGTHGGSPMVTLLQHTIGTLYGDTNTGGTHNTGAFYSLKASLAPYAALLPASGKVGKSIGILGQGFNSASGVSFNGTSATFNISSDTFLTATVPAGAKTGIVTVAIPGGNLKSKINFRVTPTIKTFTPTSGKVGAPVTITGVSLTQTSKVTFGGVKATTVVVNSDTEVTANVPSGAKTGKIAITTPGGTAISSGVFTVTQ
ncbi:MAG TPA: choice-of-anchor tandem repeat GloVer-containing protein [Terriglobales bacterium]|nr:choice-of-anchor tandem repeat GloVer-containing protein [Terriglobales bacterium]